MTNKVTDDAAVPAPKINRFPFLENIHTTVFTPPEFQVEVLDAAKEKNIVICLASVSNKAFIVVMLVKEFSCQISKGVKRCWVLTSNAVMVQQYFDLISDHANLEVAKIIGGRNAANSSHINSFESCLKIDASHKVVVTSFESFIQGFEEGSIHFNDISLLIVDDCHLALTRHPCRKLTSLIPHSNGFNGPRIVGLSISLLNQNCDPDILERRIFQLEKVTRCVTETSSNLTVLSRYSSRPEELVILCNDAKCRDVDKEIRDAICTTRSFLADHLYNPLEMYVEDDFSSITDPAVIPLTFLNDLLDILNTLGAWCTDKAAWHFMKELKKLKDKIPYERHYLLISLVYTVMEKVRAICDYHFSRLPNEKERMLYFVTPKVLRLLEILHFYRPPLKDDSNHNNINGVVNHVQHEKGCEFFSSDNHHINDFILISNIQSTADSNQTTAGFDRKGGIKYKCLCFSKNGCDFSEDQPNLDKSVVVDADKEKLKSDQSNEKPSAAKRFATGRRPWANNFRQRFAKHNTVKGNNQRQYLAGDDPNSLWAIIFIEKRYAACILNMYLKEMSRQDPAFSFVAPNFIMGQKHVPVGNTPDPGETQAEHRKQEEILRRFRMHESNVLVATSVVEDGVDLPKCNLVVRYSIPQDYKSYTQSKGRAKAIPSRYLLMVEKKEEECFMNNLRKFRGVEEILLSRCNSREIPVDEEVDLKSADYLLQPFYSNPIASEVHVKMSSAISVVNRYCARLPSDTFTRLVPHCNIFHSVDYLTCHAVLQLPINSPIKVSIKGPAMQNPALAKMAVALETCRVLHAAGEIDDNLMPMGKICAQLEKQLTEDEDDEIVLDGMPRPGTTKRRQYYNKRIAKCFRQCLPKPNVSCRLYFIYMKLTCAIPEEQNIRGRQIYQPSDTLQGFGILLAGEIPEICGFPVFTRSGEVAVKLKETPVHLELTEDQLDSLFYFHYYTFAKVLRLEKYPMCYDKYEAENSIVIVPVVQTSGNSDDVIIDWSFVDIILGQKDLKPRIVSQDERANFKFDPKKYEDAVVMPWYRNLDQPQYFYVAEICYNLTPRSDFPDDDFETFEKYYLNKYGIKIQNRNQPLLDVDHTSARLNLLTPRYVNRKGIALPTISEETKRAKRENLQQKQILVPELCSVHPFSASLWRKAVCLPCILYRLNCLLLADELRVEIAREIGLGKVILDDGFTWPALNFGWNLSDVINRQKELATTLPTPAVEKEEITKNKINSEKEPSKLNNKLLKQKNNWDPPINEFESEDNGFSIGTWSNDMANDDYDQQNSSCEDLSLEGIMMLNGSDFNFKSTNDFNYDEVRIGSPSNFEGAGWEFDSDDNGINVKSIRGLEYISASDGFNMENLTRDLEVLDQSSYSSGDCRQFSTKQKITKKLDSVESTEDYSEEDDVDEDDFEEEEIGDTEDDYESDEIGYWRPDRNVNSKPGTNSDWDIEFAWDDIEIDETDNPGNLISKPVRKNVAIRLVESDEKLQLERLKGVQEQISGIKSLTNNSDLNNRCLPVTSNVCKQIELNCDKENDGCVKSNDCDNNSATNLNKDKVNSSKEIISTSFFDASKAVIFNTEIDNNDENTQMVKLPTKDVEFSFDYQPNLRDHPGPSPSLILQALTMSNANDGINLERLETIGDSFLKHAITTYLFCTFPNIHEGKLSHLRSKQVSNLKLYRLGRRKGFAHIMVATKFEPNDNWLPPLYVVPKELEQALIDSGIPASYWNIARLPDLARWRDLDANQIREVITKHGEDIKQSMQDLSSNFNPQSINGLTAVNSQQLVADEQTSELTCFIPYNLMSQHSIPDKSIADCVEALIGAYLTSCGQRGALLVMSSLGIDILPRIYDSAAGKFAYGYLNPPPSPLQRHLPDYEQQLETMLIGYDVFEERLGYKFKDRSYLLQAFTHASYHYNRLTDCYQRLEFLGDAVLGK
ncbi:Endoribonuclease Dicer, variant 3 [Chamberlinius hualienensis]